jgi:ubiquinone/menaquinone biosynthesis C-methylase UbiE
MYAALLVRFHEFYAPMVADRKQALLSGLRGTVLELGAGTGANLPFLSKQVRWIGLDPNPFLPPYVREAARRSGIADHFGAAVAEALPAGDSSVDAVISTLVLCTVTDPALALREVLRVLKPGGRFVFIEHVAAAHGTSTLRWQKLVGPLWSRLGGGCHPDRETWKWIEAAGFQHVSYEKFDVRLRIVGPHIAGVAVR